MASSHSKTSPAFKEVIGLESDDIDNLANILQGCHEDWDIQVKSAKDQARELKETMELLRAENDHLLWHNSLYRSALAALPGGPQTVHTLRQVLKEKMSMLPLCLECEKDDLLAQLATKETPLLQQSTNEAPSSSTSPIFPTTKRKKRKIPKLNL